MEKMGIRYHVLAKNVRPWKFSGKIIPVLEFLESGTLASSMVMLIDGNDTIFTRFPSLDEIKTKLVEHKPAEIVFALLHATGHLMTFVKNMRQDFTRSLIAIYLPGHMLEVLKQ